MNRDDSVGQPEAVSWNTERVTLFNGHHRSLFYHNCGMKPGSCKRVGCNIRKKLTIFSYFFLLCSSNKMVELALTFDSLIITSIHFP